MSDPKTIVSGYRAGMKRDFARDSMPEGSFWNLLNILPEVNDARARTRSPYANASQAISAVTGSSSFLLSGIFAPYTAGESIIVFDEDGLAYEVESVTATENIGAGVVTIDPVFYNNMVIAPDVTGAAGPKKITRSGGTHTIANLGGTPPAGKYAVIFKDVLWLAAPAASADRIFFSVAGNPESWDTTNRWIDASFPITGMATLQNAVFVFGAGRTMRVRGSVPPPDSDFIVDDPIFEIGCTDARSITNYKDRVIWANANGLYISDGSLPEDLTRLCGMKSWWLDIMAGNDGFVTGQKYSTAGWVISTEVYGDYLLYSVMRGTTKVDAGVIDLVRYSWMRFSNIDMIFGFRRPYPEELFYCSYNDTILKAASSFFGGTGSGYDPNNVVITPTFETPFFMDNARLKTIRRVFVTYDLRDIGGAFAENPTLAVSYIDSPEKTAYTLITEALAETSQIERKHLTINEPMRGIALKVTQNGGASDGRFYDIELEAREREGFR